MSKGSQLCTKDHIERGEFIKHKQICLWRSMDTLPLMGSQGRRKAERRNCQGPPLSPVPKASLGRKDQSNGTSSFEPNVPNKRGRAESNSLSLWFSVGHGGLRSLVLGFLTYRISVRSNSLDRGRNIICVESSGRFTLKLMKLKFQDSSLAQAPPRLRASPRDARGNSSPAVRWRVACH